MTVELTQAPGSSSCPTMENTTDSMSDNRCDKDNPLKQVLQLCSTLAGKGCEFSISVRIKDSFAFSLKSGKSETHQGKKRSPSFYRRQERRKLLKKKNADTSLEQPLEEDLLRKRSEQSPAEKAEGHHQEEEATVDTPLNLCPKPVHTRISAGSVDTEDDFDEIQQWAAGGTVTEKSVSVSHSVRQFGSKTEEEGQEAGFVDQDAGSVDQRRPPETPRRSSKEPERDQWTSVTHKRQSPKTSVSHVVTCPKTANVPTTTERRIPASHSTWAKPALTDVRHSIWNHQSGIGTERIVFAPAEVSFDDIMKAMKTPIDWRYVRPTSYRYDKWVYFPMENAENAKERVSHVNSAPFV